MLALEILIAITLCVGHACIWTTLLNVLYSQAIPKGLLKPWRLFTGVVIAVYPIYLYWLYFGPERGQIAISPIQHLYHGACFFAGEMIFPVITLVRLLRPRPESLLEERTETLDLWKALGAAARGDGKWSWLTRLPGNCVFEVDVTELSLAPPRLPKELDGLSILLLSDLHFHGTPSKVWFDAIIDHLLTLPKPDILVLAGDYVDTDTHREWIAPILGRLQWNEIGVAILGNHDAYHHPEKIREELVKLSADGAPVSPTRERGNDTPSLARRANITLLGAGSTGDGAPVSPTRERGNDTPSLARRANITLLGAGSQEVEIRGTRVVFTGHEGPWFPSPTAVPVGGFRICVSHSPDHFRWAQSQGFDLVLCGHVHAGQIRLPLIGSIFVPSRYGRRYDMGVFEKNGTVMVVGRGVSGKEPLRFRCHPQVIRMVLRNDSSPQRGRLT